MAHPNGLNSASEVIVVGYANRRNLYVTNWVTSLIRQGFAYHLLGEGDKWQGLVARINSYLSYLLDQ